MWIANYASVPSLVRRFLTSLTRPESLRPTNRQLARPPQGFAHLYGPAVRRLEDHGVGFMLCATGKSLRKVGSEFHLDLGDRIVVAKRVVSTIPLDHALTLCDIPIEKRLPTVTLLSLFFSFSGARRFDNSILYNFDYAGAWKRLTMYSDFYGQVDDREYFAVEVIAARAQGCAEEAERDFRRHATERSVGRRAAAGRHVSAPQRLPDLYRGRRGPGRSGGRGLGQLGESSRSAVRADSNISRPPVLRRSRRNPPCAHGELCGRRQVRARRCARG